MLEVDVFSGREGNRRRDLTDELAPALDWIKVARVLLDEDDDLCVMQVHGDSFKDALVNEVDLVVVKPRATAHNGEMVAAWIEPEQATKLEYYHRENGHVRLQPANSALPPFQLKASEVEIQGQVVMIVRPIARGECRTPPKGRGSS